MPGPYIQVQPAYATVRVVCGPTMACMPHLGQTTLGQAGAKALVVSHFRFCHTLSSESLAEALAQLSFESQGIHHRSSIQCSACDRVHLMTQRALFYRKCFLGSVIYRY